MAAVDSLGVVADIDSSKEAVEGELVALLVCPNSAAIQEEVHTRCLAGIAGAVDRGEEVECSRESE